MVYGTKKRLRQLYVRQCKQEKYSVQNIEKNAFLRFIFTVATVKVCVLAVKVSYYSPSPIK